MTRDEASARAATLNGEHPQRDEFHWGVRQDERGEWSVARAHIPKRTTRDQLTPSTEAKQPRPPPDLHPGDLPGGLPPYAAGGG